MPLARAATPNPYRNPLGDACAPAPRPAASKTSFSRRQPVASSSPTGGDKDVVEILLQTCYE